MPTKYQLHFLSFTYILRVYFLFYFLKFLTISYCSYRMFLVINANLLICCRAAFTWRVYMSFCLFCCFAFVVSCVRYLVQFYLLSTYYIVTNFLAGLTRFEIWSNRSSRVPSCWKQYTVVWFSLLDPKVDNCIYPLCKD